MQKLQQLFRDFGKSLYDFEWIARQRGAGLRGMKLVALLAGVSCIVAMIFISQGITYVAGDIKKEVQQLPDFTASFEEKVLTVTGIEQPFTRRFEDVEKKWAGTIKRLKKHYTILSPLFGKAKYTRPEMKCEASEGQKMKYLSPITTDRAIVGRDHWMVEQSDIVFVDLTGSKIFFK